MQKYTAAIILVFLCLSSCLRYKALECKIVLEPDLSGKLVISGNDISSTEKSEAKRAAEMDEFYTQDFEQILTDFREKGFSDVRGYFSDKSAATCNAVIVAHFSDLLIALRKMSGGHEEDLVYRKTKEKVFVTLPPWEDDVDGARNEFSLQYHGTILEHNAAKFDRATNTLHWDLAQQNAEGMTFVLALKEQSAKENE